MITDHIDIAGNGCDASYRLTIHRFGRAGAAPSVYVQAALHADEIPGMICAVALRQELERREAAGEIAGEIILVPVANPIGLSQQVLGNPIGRFDLGDGGNFNRNFPALAPPLAQEAASLLGDDGAANEVRACSRLRELLAGHPALTPAEDLKKTLLGLALAADFVLDLHCDSEASVHLYTHPASATAFAPLAARLGCTAFLLAENSGGDPFDEALSRPWHELAQAAPERPLPHRCHAATVELRGQSDVSWELAEADAAAISAFLQDVGALTGGPSPLPAYFCEPTPLAGSLPLVAPVAGILVYQRDIGQFVTEGEILATITDPRTGARTEIRSPCNGNFFARSALRFVKPGRRLGKVAGRDASRDGNLLSP